MNFAFLNHKSETHIKKSCIILAIILLFLLSNAKAENHLRWKNQPIKLSISRSLIESFKDSDILAIVYRSLEKWESAAKVEFELEISDKQSVSLNLGDGVNLITIASTPENIMFLGSKTDQVAAKTKIFFDTKGYITEADIVLNPYVQFSTNGTFGTFDLETILTHEIGHLLGLEHSTSYSALMNPYHPQNGLYSISQISFRELSADDISKIRALYGAPKEIKNCCGTVKGKISSGLKRSVTFQVWLEDFETGRLQAVVLTDRTGNFVISGIETGKYRLFAQTLESNLAASEELGTVFVEPEKISTLSKEIQLRKRNFELDSIGINAQLSKVSVPVNEQKNYLIYVGGKNLSKNLRVKITSNYFRVISETVALENPINGLSTLSFGIEIKEGTPDGEYTVALENEEGERIFLVGAINVNSKVSVPQNLFVF